MQRLDAFRGHGVTRHALAVMLAGGVSIFAIPAQAEIILSPTGNCSTGTLATTGTTTTQVSIGCAATGSLTVNANATGNGFTTATAGYTGGSIGLVSGNLAGANGTITVTGNGTAGSAKLNVNRTIEVGFAGGTGALNIQNGGQVAITDNSNGVTIANSNSTGTVVVDGAGSSFKFPGHLGIGEQDGAHASLTISNGAVVQTTYNPALPGIGDGNTGVGAGQNSSGTLTITGAGSTLTTEGIFFGSVPTGSTATGMVSAGGTLNVVPLNAASGSPFDDGLSVGADAGATLTVTGTGSSVNVTPITQAAQFLKGKDVVIGGFATGTLIVDNAATFNAAGANVIVSGGVFGTQTSAAGTVTVKNGASLTASTVTVNQNGTLNGNGTVNANVVLNGGTLSPGNSPGTETINGNLSLLSGILNLEIASDSLADHLNVSGNVNIGTGLIINLIFEYTPAFNKVFDFNNFFSLTGGGSIGFDPSFTLSQFNVQGLGAGNAIVLTADGARAQFVGTAAVPEPASVALFLTGLGCLGGFAAARRRHKAKA
jgi:T5SS/PEP-CTERM-associated repeat protein